MSSIVVGSITFVSETIDGKEVYRGKLPSGAPVRITEETIVSSNDPAYISGKKTSILNKNADSSPEDIAALNAFYDAAPTALAPLREGKEEAAVIKETEDEKAARDKENSQQNTNTSNVNNTKAPASGDGEQTGDSTGYNGPGIGEGSDPSQSISAINTNTGQPKANSKTTIAGKAGTSKTASTADILGKRTNNPLGDFSSYTYKISLYYMDPLQFNEYVDGNRAAIKDFKLIAQSGGATQGQDIRANGFDLDFYIDDLEIKTLISSKETMTMSNSTSFKFKIYEPYGFTFTKKLATAMDLTTPDLKNVKGHFLIVFRFYGYDINGKLLHSSDVEGSPVNNSDPQAIFERGFPVVFQKFHFKLDYKTVVYDIEAVQVNEQIAKGASRGTLPAKLAIAGTTVEEMLLGNTNKKSVAGLAQLLNDNEKKLTSGKTPKFEKENRYHIEFVNADDIKNSLMAPQDDVDKKKVPMAPVKGSSGSNARTEDKNNTGSIDKKIRKMELNGQTSILQAIDQIISLSSYVKDMLIAYDKENEKVQDSDTDTYDNPNPKTISWYNVTSTVKAIGKDQDSKRNDFAYDIIYTISKYEIPFVRALYASKTMKYYGPHKRYNYWYTGKNSEILSFDLDYNYLYQLDVVGQSDAKTTNNGSASATAKASQGSDPSGTDTGTNEQVASMKSWLYSPGDLVKFKLKILGDPDYLMPTVAGGKDAVAKTFYGPDFTINPNSGQVFIEIDFKQTEDYDINKGLLDPNDSISFMNYPSELKSKIKGMTFMVTEVVSRFSKGKFEQDLKGILPEFTTIGDKGRDQDKNKTNKPTVSSQNKPDKARPSQNTNNNTNTNTNTGATKSSSYDDMSFSAAFKAARKEQGGAGGEFTWHGKEYQTNIAGEAYVKNPTPVINPQGVADDDASSNEAEMAKLKRQQEMNKPSDGGRIVTNNTNNNSRNASSVKSEYSGDSNVTDYGLG
jgi:hypothetical protein